MGAPSVTIAILNHNYERFLPAAIDSALAQRHDDVEVIVVDDGSTDGSADVVAAYGDQIVAVLKPNGGQGSAINAAFEASRGDVVIFLDADDLLEPAAAAQVATAFADDPGTAWVMFRLQFVDEHGRRTGAVRPRRTGVMPNGDLRSHLARYRCFHWQPTSGNAFARWALDQTLPMPAEDYRISADAYLAGLVPLCGPVRSLDDVLGDYRVHGASNFTSVTVDADYFRRQIHQQVVTHRHAVRLAHDLGVPLPADARSPQDCAFLGFRLASLVLDEKQHPYADERRAPLAVSGVTASLWNRQLSWRTRLRRAAWFVGTGLLPDRLAKRVAETAPDTPARRARRVRAATTA